MPQVLATLQRLQRQVASLAVNSQEQTLSVSLRALERDAIGCSEDAHIFQHLLSPGGDEPAEEIAGSDDVDGDHDETNSGDDILVALATLEMDIHR